MHMPNHPSSATVEALAVSVGEAARLLGVSRATTYKLVTAGILPSLKLGRRRLIRRCDIEAVLSQRVASSGVA